jgi:hypothetical protein
VILWTKNGSWNGSQLADTLLAGEVRFSELLSGWRRTIRFAGNHSQPSTVGSQPTKYQAIKALGFTDPEKSAHRFEQLADHKNIVEKIKQEAIAKDDLLPAEVNA